MPTRRRQHKGGGTERRKSVDELTSTWCEAETANEGLMVSVPTGLSVTHRSLSRTEGVDIQLKTSSFHRTWPLRIVRVRDCENNDLLLSQEAEPIPHRNGGIQFHINSIWAHSFKPNFQQTLHLLGFVSEEQMIPLLHVPSPSYLHE